MRIDISKEAGGRIENSLEIRVRALEQQIKNLTECTWVTPGELAKLVGMSRPRIVQEINKAELDLSLRKEPKLVRGEHYYNAARSSSIKPSWRINKDKFIEAIAR